MCEQTAVAPNAKFETYTLEVNPSTIFPGIAWSVETKFHVGSQWGGRTKKYINGQGHNMSRLVGNQQCGFLTGLTQTGLYSYRSRIEA